MRSATEGNTWHFSIILALGLVISHTVVGETLKLALNTSFIEVFGFSLARTILTTTNKYIDICLGDIMPAIFNYKLLDQQRNAFKK